MATYQRKDPYYRKAKEHGLPSRASFKIEEILKRFKLVKPGELVLDLGAAPGGWTAILSKAVGPKGKVLALDLEAFPHSPPGNTRFFQGDIHSEEADRWIEREREGKKCTCVCSDMSPKLSGIAFRDYLQSHELGMKAHELAKRHLKPGGNFVVKQFPGAEFADFLKTLRQNFNQVKVVEPAAIRKTSKEVYLVCLGIKGSLRDPGRCVFFGAPVSAPKKTHGTGPARTDRAKESCKPPK